MRRVAVTGIGIWSCIGQGVHEVEQSLRAGRSGIGTDPQRTDYGYHSPLTGIVPHPVLKGLVDRRTRAGMPEQTEYAYMAAREALTMAYGEQLTGGMAQDLQDVGCIFGSDSSAKPLIEAHELMREYHDSEYIGAGNIFQTMNSTVTMNLANIFHLQGLSLTISAACASSSHAIGMAAMLIRQGMQRAVLCGGAQEVNKYAVSSFDALGVFSSRTDKPEEASRPFDAERDGLVTSGGAAALLLEDYEQAQQRGAEILAEVAGYGFSTNGTGHLSTPNADAILRAMQNALDDAQLQPQQIDYVNAHATSTTQGDAAEAAALTRLFPSNNHAGSHDERPWVSSTKSMTGHECWMAGASEAVYSILMMRGGFVAPNINLQQPCDEAASLRLARTAQQAELHAVLSNSFGFGGTNSALIFTK